MRGINSSVLLHLVSIFSTYNLSESFTSYHSITQKQSFTAIKASNDNSRNETPNRRSILKSLLSAATTLSISNAVSAEEVEIRGTKIDNFNGLSFNYRGNDFNGLDASTLNEPSISYMDFLSKLGKGEVEFVKFYAPDGDVAYATLKDMEKPIRIGEGYPIEQHDGYSSPAFAIRSVKEKGVPYKFVLPALDAYK